MQFEGIHMIDRVGEVYHWTMDDDIFLIVAEEDVNLQERARWRVVSLLTAKSSWFNETWFDGYLDTYLVRLA